jgi:hypothetical protein
VQIIQFHSILFVDVVSFAPAIADILTQMCLFPLSHILPHSLCLPCSISSRSLKEVFKLEKSLSVLCIARSPSIHHRPHLKSPYGPHQNFPFQSHHPESRNQLRHRSMLTFRLDAIVMTFLTVVSMSLFSASLSGVNQVSTLIIAIASQCSNSLVIAIAKRVCHSPSCSGYDSLAA